MRSALAGGAAALVMTLAAPVAAQDPGLTGGDDRPSQERYHLRAQYREFHPGLSGKVQKGQGQTEGTLIDLDDDLAIEDKRRFDVRAAIQFKSGVKLRGAWTQLDYDGDTQAVRTFTYGATRYDRFSRIVTSIKGNYYAADIEWDFLQRPQGYLGLVAGAKGFDVDTVVLSPSQENSREVDTLRAPIPVVGLTGRLYISRVSLEAEGVGMSLGDTGKLYEVEGSVRVHISDRLALQGGYRVLKLDGKDERDRVKMDLGGFTFGLELSL
jgi:hypothetical protein